jgi:hypothetical protein
MEEDLVTTAPAANGFRFFYIDDSGAPDTGYVLYSWIEVKELHASPFVNGREHPSTNISVNRSKRSRRAVMAQALGAIGANGNIGVGTVYRVTSARRKGYARERARVYSALIGHLDRRLARAGEYGFIFMDGDGSDATYFRAHRDLKLASRRILEDPLFQHSQVSQWVQMADMVAWTTYQSLLRHAGKEFVWNWYDMYLRDRDVNGGPIAI